VSDRIAQDLAGEKLTTLLRRLENWPWPDADLRVTRIQAGFTNVNWMLDIDGVRHFLKVPGTGTEAYIERTESHNGAMAAFEAGIGPEVLYFEPDSGIEVSVFLEGYTSLLDSQLRDPGVIESIAGIYRELHGRPLLSNTRTVFDMIDGHLEHLGEIGRPLRPYQSDVIRRWLPIQKRYIDAGLDLVPGHNDMLTSNYMVAEGRPMKLVDYDFAANTDRWYELGGVFALSNLEPKYRHQALVAYLGEEPTPEVLARVHLSSVATYVTWGLWALVNSSTRDSDTDYEKYGAGNLIAAAWALDRDETEAAVRAL
jgi:thiamine kinase-like enzyme